MSAAAAAPEETPCIKEPCAFECAPKLFKKYVKTPWKDAVFIELHLNVVLETEKLLVRLLSHSMSSQHTCKKHTVITEILGQMQEPQPNNHPNPLFVPVGVHKSSSIALDMHVHFLKAIILQARDKLQACPPPALLLSRRCLHDQGVELDYLGAKESNCLYYANHVCMHAAI
eukprot:scaffold143016_cov17-Tisochrysis_lutea.AAC.1